MKKIIFLLSSLIILYSIYHDLTAGTLPAFSANAPAEELVADSKSEDKSSFSQKIRPGDTVLSILEAHQQGILPVAIEQVVNDFSKLNKGMKPEEIQPGETYNFPIYPQKID